MQMCCTQVCWEKFTRYFDVEEKFVHLTNDCFVLTPEKAIELVDENTIGDTVSSSPGFPCSSCLFPVAFYGCMLLQEV